MQLNTYQKVCVALIIVLLSIEYVPIIYANTKSGPKVKPGQIWRATLYNVTVYMPAEYEITWSTYRKVISVDNDQVTYMCQNDTMKYVEDIDAFTFNGVGLQCKLIQDIYN